MSELAVAIVFGLWSLFCLAVGMVLRKGLFNVTVDIDASAHEHYWPAKPKQFDEPDPADAWKDGPGDDDDAA